MKSHNRDAAITTKIVACIVLAVIVSSMSIGLISYNLHRSVSIEARGREAVHIAAAAARRIDGDQFTAIMESMEKTDYWEEISSYADDLARDVDTAYLYIVQTDQAGNVVYFTEGAEDPFDLGDTDDPDAYAEEMYQTLADGVPTITDAYDSGEYGTMVSGFAAVKDSAGRVVGVVGVDFFLNDIIREVNAFGFAIAGVVLGFIVLILISATLIGRKALGRPLTALDQAAKQLARGDMNIRMEVEGNTEIARLSQSFNDMVAAMQVQVSALETISHGDLVVNIQPRCDADTMGQAIVRLLRSLNTMFSEIDSSSRQVSAGSGQISTGAQTLAQGTSEQAAAVEELSASITQVAEVSAENAAIADKAADLARNIKQSAQTGTEQMNRMLAAVRDINEASHNIGKVIKVVDDIAFQTNILALNAAVEAARAGQHGKGFAVVAEEVRNLAAKSAAAAKDTGTLIAGSMEKAELGARIADETSGSLREIVEGIDESSRIINIIANSHGAQDAAIRQINKGIEQVSQIVQQNSAAAQESAASSAQISGQADALQELIGQFNIDPSVAAPRLPVQQTKLLR